MGVGYIVGRHDLTLGSFQAAAHGYAADESMTLKVYMYAHGSFVSSYIQTYRHVHIHMYIYIYDIMCK